jgi:hypothetical protein
LRNASDPVSRYWDVESSGVITGFRGVVEHFRYHFSDARVNGTLALVSQSKSIVKFIGMKRWGWWLFPFPFLECLLLFHSVTNDR